MGNKVYLSEHPHMPDHKEYVFHCPGCGYAHSFVTAWGAKALEARRERYERLAKTWGEPPTWTFNGNLANPTFTPSLLYHAAGSTKRCHLFVTNGQIVYLDDCEHELKGKTIPMEDVR